MTTEMQMVNRRAPEVAVEETLTRLQAKADARDQAMRVRLQPTVLDHETKMYVALPGVSWMLDLNGSQAIRDLRAAMEVFFEVTAGLGGPSAMKAYMEDVRAAVLPAPGVASEGGQ